MNGTDGVLGVVLAGGESRRYGRPKALAEVDGRSLLSRALSTLDEATGRAVVVANDPALCRDGTRSVRPDLRPGTGVLGGLLTAVEWARESGAAAAAVLACDMPFVPAALVARLVEASGIDRVSLPESDGPRGVEPLCAVYGVGCGAAIRDALDRGERAVISFFDDVDVRRLPIAEVRRFGEPGRLFFNVNRPEERDRAERMAGDPHRATPGASDE